ncbi:MAG TPA: hypothetical protein VN493_28480 [Thermoanaerobaculia bacterium]|nr:hypothetical protein [Thermoanaerobaculia bacterium]
MITRLSFAALALLLAAGVLSADAPVPPENIPVPELGRTPGDFKPHGWTLLQSVSGDFDGDGVADAAIAFEADRPDPDWGIHWRLLVLARGAGQGRLHRIWFSPRVLPTREGAEEKLGPLSIEDGALVLRRWGQETRVWLRMEDGEPRVVRMEDCDGDGPEEEASLAEVLELPGC